MSDTERLDWLEADSERLEDVLGHVNNSGSTVREAIDFMIAYDNQPVPWHCSDCNRVLSTVDGACPDCGSRRAEGSIASLGTLPRESASQTASQADDPALD